MSYPTFPKPEDILNREEALTAIITSIAMEEQALAHIIEAESEKICYAIKHAKSSCADEMQTLLQVNDSAANLLERIHDIQMLLKNKLRIAVSALPKLPEPPKPPVPPKPPCPPVPPKPPKPPYPPGPPKPPKPSPCHGCVSEFSADKLLWLPQKNLYLDQKCYCGDGVKLTRKQCETYIVLPAGSSHEIEILLRLSNKSHCPVEIELLQENGDLLISSCYTFDGKKQEVRLHDTLVLEGKGKFDSLLSLRLVSQNSLEIKEGRISVKEIEEGCCRC